MFLKGFVGSRVDAPQAFRPLAVNYKELLPAAAKEFKTGTVIYSAATQCQPGAPFCEPPTFWDTKGWDDDT